MDINAYNVNGNAPKTCNATCVAPDSTKIFCMHIALTRSMQNTQGRMYWAHNCASHPQALTVSPPRNGGEHLRLGAALRTPSNKNNSNTNQTIAKHGVPILSVVGVAVHMLISKPMPTLTNVVVIERLDFGKN